MFDPANLERAEVIYWQQKKPHLFVTKNNYMEFLKIWLKESTEVAYNNVSNRKIINSFGRLNVQLKSVKVYLKLSQGVTLIAHIMTLAVALKTKLQQFTNRNESWHYSFLGKKVYAE